MLRKSHVTVYYKNAFHTKLLVGGWLKVTVSLYVNKNCSIWFLLVK
jgi:hypothetical protein